MLVQKKISIKKLAIYISIIFFMIIGTSFMLYENKSLTSRQPTTVNAPIVFNNSLPAASTTAPLDNASGAGGADNQTAAGSSQALDINKINQNGGLDLTIFSSDKFKILEKSVPVIKERPEVGKRNPFKPN